MKPVIALIKTAWRGVRYPAMTIVLALGMAGCTLLPKSEPLVRYELPVSPVPARLATPLPLTLSVMTPLANQAVNSDRILVVPAGHEIQAYQGVRWIDLAPVLLRNHMALALRESGLVQMVVPGGAGLGADVWLGSDLSAFQVRYVDGAPVVQVVLDAALIRPDTGRPLAAQRFLIEQPVQGGAAVAQVVQAFGLAVQALNRQLVDWAAPLLQTYGARASGSAAG